MPKIWLYYIALVLPLFFRVLILNTGFVDWLWYQHHEEAWQLLSTLKVQPQFLEFIGGWPLPVFIGTVICWWQIDEGESIPAQFLLLPLGYVPFTIISDTLINASFNESDLYIHPLIIIPIGYIYVVVWTLFIWVLEKLGLIM